MYVSNLLTHFVAPQVPVWTVWKAQAAHVATANLTIIRDSASKKSRNLLVIREVCNKLMEHGCSLASNFLFKRIKRKDMFTDPVLLAELRSMGTVKAKTSGGVSLATCGAVASAISKHIPQLQNVADAVRELASKECPSFAGIVDERHLSAGQAREARLPRDVRRVGDASSSPPSAADDPIPGSMLDVMKRRGLARQQLDHSLPPAPTVQQHRLKQPAPQPSKEAIQPTCLPPAVEEPVHPPIPAPSQPLSNQPVRNVNESIPNHPNGGATADDEPMISQQEAGPPPIIQPPSPPIAVVTPASASTGGQIVVGLGLSRQQQAWYYTVGSKLPSSLPNLVWGPESLDKRGRFGLFYLLKPLPDNVPAKWEVQALEKWCCRLYNFNDGGTTGVSKSTWQGIYSTVSKFLGFAYTYEKVPIVLLSLRLFSNPVRGLVAMISIMWVWGKAGKSGNFLWRKAWEGRGPSTDLSSTRPKVYDGWMAMGGMGCSTGTFCLNPFMNPSVAPHFVTPQVILVRFLDFMVNRTGQLHMQVEITRISRVVKYLEDVDACSLPLATEKVIT